MLALLAVNTIRRSYPIVRDNRELGYDFEEFVGAGLDSLPNGAREDQATFAGGVVGIVAVDHKAGAPQRVGLSLWGEMADNRAFAARIVEEVANRPETLRTRAYIVDIL